MAETAFREAMADLGLTVHDTDKAALLAWLDSDECAAWEAADPFAPAVEPVHGGFLARHDRCGMRVVSRSRRVVERAADDHRCPALIPTAPERTA